MTRAERFVRRVAALASKEATHIRRDPRMLYMALAMPVLLLVLFGYGVSFDVDRVPLLAVDHDRTAASRELAQRFVATDDFRLAGEVEDEEQVGAAFRRFEAAMAIVVPAGYSRALARGETTPVQLIVDGSDPSTTGTALAMGEAMGRAANLRAAASIGRSMDPPLTVRTWTRYNPEARSALFLVPGLIAYILALVAVMLTALTVAREWERGSMEQLFATPVGRLDIIVGKLLPYLVLGSLQVLMVLALGAWMFDVPARGNLLVLATASLLFLVGMLGQGLLISVVTKNQMVATQAATLSSMLPSMLLSGFLFPVENMPVPLQWASNVVPARYFIEVLRGVLLKGTSWSVHGGDLLALAAFALLMIAMSTARFERRIA